MEVDVIHERIAEAVNSAAIQGNTRQVSALGFMPAYPEVPMFYPYRWTAAYDKTHGGLVELTSEWHLVVSRADDEAGHQEAARLAGSGENTIRKALIVARGEPSPTPTALGGAADDIHLRSSSGPTPVEIGETHLLVIEFDLFIMGN